MDRERALEERLDEIERLVRTLVVRVTELELHRPASAERSPAPPRPTVRPLEVATPVPPPPEPTAPARPEQVTREQAQTESGKPETSHATTHDDPVYEVDGVTHYCVANMPGAVPITSTKALTNVTLPYVEAIADEGLAQAIARDKALARGVNVLDGRITYEAVA